MSLDAYVVVVHGCDAYKQQMHHITSSTNRPKNRKHTALTELVAGRSGLSVSERVRFTPQKKNASDHEPRGLSVMSTGKACVGGSVPSAAKANERMKSSGAGRPANSTQLKFFRRIAVFVNNVREGEREREIKSF